VSRRRALALAAVALLARPAVAAAHTISTDPVAGDYQARIVSIRPSTDLIQLRVVDGDQRLWMRVRPGADVVVLGAAGERFLRFAGGQIDVNTRSITALLDKLSAGPATSFRADTVPTWKRLAGGDAYLWPERRIGTLEPLAVRAPPGVARWTIPRVVVSGQLLHRSPPGAWLWAAVAAATIALAAAAAASRRRHGGGASMLAWVGLAGTIALVVARVAREAYGRPDLGLGNWVELALTLSVGLPACYLLARGRPDARAFVGLVVGVLGVYQTLRFAPMLTHGLVFTGLPAGVERACVAVMAAASPATLLLAVFGEQRAVQADSSARTSSTTRLGRKGAT
jgi:hypothetical protein